jgi:hypothetical protein
MWEDIKTFFKRIKRDKFKALDEYFELWDGKLHDVISPLEIISITVIAMFVIVSLKLKIIAIILMLLSMVYLYRRYKQG